ncbi:hypothetical protein HOD20_09795 [archaeon]|jgi:hypothetical protein|nr:hypothetical protein [Candidatus Woesearchaeota archaeon]MBT3465442.1 hypothetical protein [archaeon]MBT4352802.1 hypothetical protein [archaeon]MBT4647573.1 hypothetical protein [archaeon]MBT6821931.1 hypothetical protein [archaeon]
MFSFIQGTLIISNIILIFLAILYGFLIITKKKKDESIIWIYFIISCSLFFLAELVDFLSKLLFVDVGLIKSILRIMFGTIILLAFITKYSKI